MGDSRYRGPSREPPRLLQRNADGFFESPVNGSGGGSAFAPYTNNEPLPSRSQVAVPPPRSAGNARARSKSRTRQSPSGPSGSSSAYANGGRSGGGGSSSSSRRPSEDSYDRSLQDRDRYRRPSDDGVDGRLPYEDRDRRRPSGGGESPLSSSRTSPAMERRRPSIGTDYLPSSASSSATVRNNGSSYTRSGSGSNISSPLDAQRSVTTKAPSSSSSSASRVRNDEFASILPSRIREGSGSSRDRDVDINGAPDRPPPRGERRPSDRDGGGSGGGGDAGRSRTMRADGMPDRSASRPSDRDPPPSLREREQLPSRVTTRRAVEEPLASAAASSGGAQSASFDDMLKALEDLHVKTAANPPRSTAISPAQSATRLAPPATDRPASGRTSREYERMAASLDQLISSPKDRDDRERGGGRETRPEREQSRTGDRDRGAGPELERTTTSARDRGAAREQARAAARAQRDGKSSAAAAAVAAPTTTSKSPLSAEPTAAAAKSAAEPLDPEAERREAREVRRKRVEQERIEAERRDADLRENEMIAKARQLETAADRARESARNIEREARADESIIIPDYVSGLMMTLRTDKDAYPVPDDFMSSDGYAIWESSLNKSFADVLVDYLRARFLERRRRGKEPMQRPREEVQDKPVTLRFKVVEARDLIAKPGSTRNPYCEIEHGVIPDDGTEEARRADKDRSKKEVMQTQVITGTCNPRWDQQTSLTVRNMTDKVMVSVYDKLKEHFLGRVKITFGDVVPAAAAAARDGPLKKWYRLTGMGRKEKDKYVGGDMLVEISITDGGSLFGPGAGAPAASSSRDRDLVDEIQGSLMTTKVDFRSIYKVLLRSCLILDMNMLGSKINEHTTELLSDESTSLLLIVGRTWRLSEAFMTMSLLELLFKRYKRYEIPQGALLRAYERVKSNLKQPGWLAAGEKAFLINLLSEMDQYYRTQISKYKEFFPKNTPKDALETTIMMLRMICKVQVYREANPKLPESFREEFRSLLTEAAIARYQKLSELSQPLDDTDVEGVIEGVLKLAELVTEEIDLDAKYFREPFAKEVDIVRLTSEQYLKYFVLTLESNTEHISSETAVETASKSVFDLYRRVKVMDARYAKLVPGLKRMSMNAGFNVERWFSPFISRWLEHLSSRTVEWVNNAVKADQFEPVADAVERGGGYSSSVTDLFSAVYQELEFIKGLEWSDPVQSAGFMQAFAKSVSKAIEHYCEAIALGETKVDPQTSGTSWQGLLATATASVGKSSASTPTDIANESCVKLCNIEYAMKKLDDMYRVMNVQELNRVLRRHRAALADSPTSSRNNSRENIDPTVADDTYVKGAFKIQLLYAENLKPCNKNGLANPYIIVRVPDGTVVPMSAEPTGAALRASTGPVAGSASSLSSIVGSTIGGSRASTGSNSAGPTVLNGIHCELARSRVVSDTINPTWDEAFEVILPPVTKIEVAVLSKNLLTADEIAGKAMVDLSRGTRLRHSLGDHHTHDVYVEMEPQGRVLLRLTMEGADEDVDFWFRRSKERLGRMRDDFVRALTARIIPYAREEILRVIVKTHEAAPLPAKNFFSSLTTSVQYSKETASGVPISQPISDADADALLDPLTEYLNKNLGTLDVYLSEKMSHEVIRRCWDEIVSVVEHACIPPLYGPIESTRRVLNRRQASMASATLRLLKDFFHADGAGVSNRSLETKKFALVRELAEVYYLLDIPKLQREYDRELLKGRDKEMALRLVRLRVEKSDGGDGEHLDPLAAEEGRVWIDQRLTRRKVVCK
ncbi:hypothetical protein HDU86_004235 [Geranomyces michiganensis]|nr:hypothetical protein HDU86_004235 [Geranomyces michiganensis]